MEKQYLSSTIQVNKYIYHKPSKYKCISCKHLFTRHSTSKNIRHCDGCRLHKR